MFQCLSAAAERRPTSAACDSNTKAFDWFKASIPTLDFVTTDYRELLARQDVDAIYCAVPHNLHADFYCDIIRSGKHLLGEKPFGIDLKANEEITKVIARSESLPAKPTHGSSVFWE